MFPILWREKLHRIHKPVSLRQERRPETLSSGSLVLDIGANGGSRVTSKLDLNKGSILMFKGISKVRLLLPLNYKGISKILKIEPLTFKVFRIKFFEIQRFFKRYIICNL